MSLTLLAVLALVGFASGFVDAIAGGGGLLTLPALAPSPFARSVARMR